MHVPHTDDAGVVPAAQRQQRLDRHPLLRLNHLRRGGVKIAVEGACVRGCDAAGEAVVATAATAATAESDGAKDGPVGDENPAAARANGSDKAAAAWSSSVLASADGW